MVQACSGSSGNRRNAGYLALWGLPKCT